MMIRDRLVSAGIVAMLTAAWFLTPAPQVSAGAQTGRSAAAPREIPRLIVLLVVDQFRADYVEQYGGQWSQGLHELFSRGAVFTRATVPSAVSRTCTGHATIGTGTFPATHGMVDTDGSTARAVGS
jgi:predicted AlkP superfamily pyrophosphatase or phosphodiesterase